MKSLKPEDFENLVTIFGERILYCPECYVKKDLAVKTKTLETRHYHDEANNQPVVRRRHACPECLTAFYTMESVEH